MRRFALTRAVFPTSPARAHAARHALSEQEFAPGLSDAPHLQNTIDILQKARL